MQLQTILIIGVGNIGKRYLQTISAGGLPLRIFCHDRWQEALDSIGPFCATENIDPKSISCITDYGQALDKIDPQTLVVISTTAKGRENLLADILSRRPLAVIAEKPVTQTRRGYEKITDLADKTGVPVYVDFPRHLNRTYQTLFERMDKEKDAVFIVNLPNIGFGCNGIHFLELATWLLAAERYEIIHSAVTSTYESKRKGFYDFSARLVARMGKHLCVVIVGDEESPLSVDVIQGKERHTVYETAGKMITAVNGSIDETAFELGYLSVLMKEAIADIASEKKPRLPTLGEARLAHMILFDVMERGKIGDMNFT